MQENFVIHVLIVLKYKTIFLSVNFSVKVKIKSDSPFLHTFC